MRIYDVFVHLSAQADIDGIADFLFANLSQESAYKYLRTIGDEIKSLSVYADCFAESRSKTIRSIHPHARRMLSHNRKWNYIFHIENDFVILDRVLPSKMIIQ
jgi:plasmid stabilization system protein ParE